MFNHLVYLARSVVNPGPVLWPSLVILLVLAPVAWLGARLLHGSGTAGVLASWSLVAAVDVTVARDGFVNRTGHLSRVLACSITDPTTVTAEGLLNVLLFVPLGLFTVLAVRRPVATALAALVVSCGFELAQATYGVGVCDSSDVVHNVAGALIGIALGIVASSLHQPAEAVAHVPQRPRALSR